MSGSITVTLKGKDKSVLNVGGGGSVTLGADKAQGAAYYPALIDKPSIEGHTLIGDSTLPQIGVRDITPQAIDKIIFG